MIKKIICLALTIGMLMSCGFVYEKKITGKFFLIAVDGIDDMSLTYYTIDVYQGIVSGGVYKLSLNDKYFIVKRHPYIDDDSRRLVFDRTECYIVEISNDEIFFDEQKCYGPYSEEQLLVKQRELGIDNLEVFYERRKR